MRIKVSNFIAEFLAGNGITHVFTVTGGGAMHLNDAFGHSKDLGCIYNHHEQACAIAAESYARIHNRIAVVCVTTGPGGTNALTGVVGAYLDSIPMLVISGQVRYDTTARWSGVGVRSIGDQEFDICKAAESMTKYCEMVVDPLSVKACLQKALYISRTGRPGPCWLDIPLNVQGAYVDTDMLPDWDGERQYDASLPPAVDDAVVDRIVAKVRESRRPVLYAGNGIRISGGHEAFLSVVDKLGIPVVTCWDSIDAIHDNHPLYVGRGGMMGDRPGNFAVQNSDLVLSVGSRLSIRQVGFNYRTWAREAYVIVNDVDAEELRKPTLHVDMPVWADAKDLLERLDARLTDGPVFGGGDWLSCCAGWKRRYPVVQPGHLAQQGPCNVYAFVAALGSRLDEGRITVVGNGSACVVGSQAYVIRKGQRFIINSAIASMGYDLPAAIGACIASGRREIVNVTGDGSIQMNIQELQTIVTNALPIKIFVINNGGYHSIRQTQLNYFGEPLVGIGPESRDLGFPDMSKLAPAYGYPYFRIRSNDELPIIDQVLAARGPAICEVMVDSEQGFEPKAASRRLPDGTIVSAPLEDLAPFLPDEELAGNMFVSPVGR